ADQASMVAGRTATDATSAAGCGQCLIGRDSLTGWGRLDIARAIGALANPLPPTDRLEPNDDAGSHAPVLPASVKQVKATVDYWDDQVDVYKTRLGKGQGRRRGLTRPPTPTPDRLRGKPGTRSGDQTRGLRSPAGD